MAPTTRSKKNKPTPLSPDKSVSDQLADEGEIPASKIALEEYVRNQFVIHKLGPAGLLKLHGYCTGVLSDDNRDRKEFPVYLNVLDIIAQVLATTINKQTNFLKDQSSTTYKPAQLSYAAAARSSPSSVSPTTSPALPKETTIILKPETDTSAALVESKVKSFIKASRSNHKINYMKATNKVVIVKVPKLGPTAKQFVEEINKSPKVNKICTAYFPKSKHPTVVIKNVAIEVGFDLNKIVDQICSRNEALNNLNDEITFMFKMTNEISEPGTASVAIRVSPKVYHIITNELRGRVYLDTQCCPVQQKIFIRQCQKCFRFDHTKKQCPAGTKEVCRDCGMEKSDSHQCSHVRCCTNCAKSPKHQTNTNHRPNTDRCPLYNSQMRRIFDQTQFDPDG